MTLKILEPHGFCAGVTHALRQAHSLAEKQNNTPLYCLHELVHNEIVVKDLAEKGFKFTDNIEEIPSNSTVLFSAHGVSKKIRARAKERNLTIVDATCPFVARVHRAARAFYERGLQVLIIGHQLHAEVQGILGEAPNAIIIDSLEKAQSFQNKSDTPIGIVSQTTMNSDDVQEIVNILRARAQIETMAEVCNATKERQDAVKNFSGDALLVLGSANSSNTLRLCEVAKCKTFRAGTLDEVKTIDFSNVKTLGITSGASTPEVYFKEVVDFLINK